MIDRDYSLKIKSAYNPTKDEIIEFAYNRSPINVQDWELGIIWPIDNIKVIINLAADMNCQKHKYFLRCLYLFAGDFIMGGYDEEIDAFKDILSYAQKFENKDIKDWIQRAEDLFNNPEKYDYAYWSFGSKYLYKKHVSINRNYCCEYHGGYPLIIIPGNDKFKLMNKNGEIIKGIEYDSIYGFTEEGSVVKKGNKYGYIDNKGIEIIPPKFVSAYSFNNGIAHVFEEKEHYYINKKGEEVECFEEPQIETFTDNFAIEIKGKRYKFPYSFDTNISNPLFGEIYSIEKRLSVFYLAVEEKEYTANKYGVINEDGNIIVEPSFDYIGVFVDDIAELENDEKWGYLNNEGNLITDIIFDETRPFCEDLAKVRIGDKWGYINKSGDFVIEPKFDIALDFEEDVARVKWDGKWAVINKSGNIIYEGFVDVFKEGHTVVPMEGKYGYINNLGEILVGGEFDEAYGFREGLAVVKMNEKYGFVNKKGDIAIETKYEDAFNFRGGIGPIKVDDKWGFINKLGDVVIEPQFDYIYIDNYCESK